MNRLLLNFLSAITGISLLWASLPMAYAYADPTPEYALKAAFIYNFANFTEWPVKSAETLNLCVLGSDPFDNALSSIEGKRVGYAKLVIKHVAINGNALRSCQMVFISASEKGNLPAILDIARESGILTIADLQGAAQQGVMIGLEVEQKKITFEVNLDAARRARLNISSKLLRLAKAVY
ncbi:hypothetical protein SCD_n01101 [Sulfuricella denitrificans skB26]|uniref:Transmembrane protein n=1 Tax=Sulfuricella denitrificans (strain DSM 22764 / NBRC 105220 / skB26) TaxID=1163617 RepID=S6B2N3_SULDS|nr:YfiR family protein [Sulfuricella denitrificans]BAN34937.1 hypothetical protein SCD_n01101 [Sulfuricella denitrificans skB26]